MELWQAVEPQRDSTVLVILEADHGKVGGLVLTVSDTDGEEWRVPLSPAAVVELRDALNGWPG